MNERDPFTGTWTFRADLSKLSTLAPRNWIQVIHATADEVQVREEILSAEGHRMIVTAEARFDGKQYPVSGSPAADAIAYTRIDSHAISGTASKNNNLSIKETLTAAPEGNSITLTYSILHGGREVANGIAVFERTKLRPEQAYEGKPRPIP